MNKLLFYLVIFAANIIQGITGFAGTILAMPFGMMLVGYSVAKPILNVLGLLSGIYVFVGQKKHIDWHEVRKIVCVMAVGIFCGIGIKSFFSGKEQILYLMLGIFVIALSIEGLYRMLVKQKNGSETADGATAKKESMHTLNGYLLLSAAGIVHGIFVSGGPLLIGYLTRQISDKKQFRATISTVWIVLNTLILLDDIRNGLWTVPLLGTFAWSIPFLLAGMFLGGRLMERMSQRAFLLLTYILLFIAGIALLAR